MKTINSKSIVLLLICFITLTSCSAQKMVFEHVGISDKPLPTIEINVNQVQKSDSIKVFVVDKNVFEAFEKYTKVYFDKNVATGEMDYGYGTYKVTLYSGSKKNDYFLESNEKSVTFFKGLMGVMKSKDELYKEIEVLLRRLK